MGQKSPGNEGEGKAGADAGHGAMCELDHRREPGVVRKDLAVAQRPVRTAACTGAGGPDDRSLQHDKNHPGERACGEGGKTTAAAKKDDGSAHASSLRGSCELVSAIEL